MKIDERLHGFRVTEVRPREELDATMVRMTYEKNGADLIWLDRPDENKTFAIAFKTIPDDDTGVFHILEHSVLSGSRKYPVKEPFVNLLKSSLQTFLNAMTFPDKTMYPVSSRNDKDFLNLMDVYMDAVLHPLAITDPHAFRQEGWHYELDGPDGELTYNGVVFNEMKGAFASYEDVLQFEINRQLFPDTCYGCESGGCPEAIPDLTYEQFVADHRRFYHPSNSRIFLDGAVDIGPALAKLDSFLCEYDALAVDAEIPMQAPVTPDEVTRPYEVSEGSDERLMLAQGWVYGDFTDKEKSYALNVLAEVLTGSNEAPLTKAILDRGLAMDVDLQGMDGILQPYLVLVLKKTPLDKHDEAWAAVEETLEQVARDGLDHKRLHAALNRLEFTTREKDYGTTPRGLVYGMMALDTWLYGGDPMQNVLIGDVFDQLRARIDEGYFEALLRECMIDNKHTGRVTLTPSATLGEEKAAAERARLAAVRATWDDADVADAIEQFRVLREKQSAEDTPEQIAKLPTLSLDDVPVEVRKVPLNVSEADGRTVLHADVNTEGIIYLDLYFAVPDLEIPELQKAAVFAKLLGDVATTHYDVNDLQSEIDANLGRLSASASLRGQTGVTDAATPMINVSVSLLEGNKDAAVRLLREVLFESRFDDTGYILNEIKQARIGLEQSIIAGGNSYARQRVVAGTTVLGALTEAVYGIDMLRFVQQLEASYEADGAAFCQSLGEFAKRIFTKDRVTACVTGPVDLAWVGEVLTLLGDAPMGPAVPYTVSDRPKAEGFRIPAAVSFTAKGGNLYALGEEYTGAASVAATILTYGYLWNTIRVKGGAYGTGLRMALNGDVQFSSFRDPSGDRSIHSFDRAADALRDVCAGGEPLDNYIISTIGGQDPLLTPRLEGKKAILQYFLGQTREDRERVRSQVLHTTAEDLCRVADQLDTVCRTAGVCVIGGADILDACGSELDKVENLQK